MLVRAVHDRMPVIVRRDALDVWLSADPLPPKIAGTILRPYDADEMLAEPVSKRVNNSRNDGLDVLNHDDSVQPKLGL
jgi:putative SOS response-associated peptidase YedK